jgi:CBS domain-containing protein
MTAEPVCCGPDDTAERAAHLMEQNDCGCIPVVRDDRVVGVITDRDIAVRGVGHSRSFDTRIGELMTTSPRCCGPDAELREVEQIMSDNQIRRVVIVDDEGCCVGIVAQADLALAAKRDPRVTDAEVGRLVERISEP